MSKTPATTGQGPVKTNMDLKYPEVSKVVEPVSITKAIQSERLTSKPYEETLPFDQMDNVTLFQKRN